VSIIDRNFPDGTLSVQRAAWSGATSRWFDSTTNTWSKGKAASHALLEHVSNIGALTPQLTAEWNDVKKTLLALIDASLVSD
jgi:hypothetical protein